MKKTRVEIVCIHCGKTVEMHVYRLRRGTGKYCSQACYLAHRWGTNGSCLFCGTTTKTKFCSHRCQKNYWNQHGYRIHRVAGQWKRKIALVASLGGKCSVCGIDDIRVLDIDHIDPSQKVRPKKGQYTWSRRFADWKKNVGNLRLLCANCHRIHTWEQRGFDADNHTQATSQEIRVG